MKKAYIVSFLLSLLVFLITCWTAKFTVYAAGWAESLSFFVLTLLLLEKYAEPGTYGVKILITILAGRLILEVPIRVLDFAGSLFSMFVPIIVICSIGLAAIYFHEKKKGAVLILLVAILILLNTAAHSVWLQQFGHGAQ